MDPARRRAHFNDDGTADYPGWPTTSGLLHEIRDQLRLLLQKLKTCERLPDGSICLNDKFTGKLKGVQVVWDRVVLLSMMTMSVHLPGLLPEERNRMNAGEVICKTVDVPRQSIPISESMKQLSFTFAGTGSKIPDSISEAVFKRLSELLTEIELHCNMLGEEMPPVAPPKLNGAPLPPTLTDQIGIAFESARRLQGSITALLGAATRVEFKIEYWSRISPMYPSVYLDARDLTQALTKDVREAIRLLHPLGSAPIRLIPEFTPRHTYIEVLAHDVMGFLNIEKPEIDIALEAAMKERPSTEWDGPDSRSNQSGRIAKVLESWAPDHYLERQVGFLLRAASGLALEDLRIHIEQEHRHAITSPPAPPKEELPDEDFAPLDMFPKIVKERLKKAVLPSRMTKKVRFKDFDGQRRYSISDARRIWMRDMQHFGKFS